MLSVATKSIVLSAIMLNVVAPSKGRLLIDLTRSLPLREGASLRQAPAPITNITLLL